MLKKYRKEQYTFLIFLIHKESMKTVYNQVNAQWQQINDVDLIAMYS